MAKAKIKIVSVQKSFSQSDLDCFRRILNVMAEHGLSAELQIKEVKTLKLVDNKLKVV